MRTALYWFAAVLFAIVLLSVPPLAQAQAPLGIQSLFLESRLGVAHYAGENGASPLFAECPAGVDGCRAAAYGAALEAGVRWSPSFSTSLSYQAANYPSIGASDVVPPSYASAYRTRTTVQLLGQYHFADLAPWTTPYLQAGLHVTTGRTPLPDDRLQSTGQLLVGQRWTVGPSVGAGLSFPVSRHVAVFTEATVSLATPDRALDGSGGFWGVDRLGWAGVGLRINSSALPHPDATGSPDARTVDAVAPRVLTVDEMGRFQVRTAEGLPEDQRWQWVFSDGTVREGRVVTKRFSTAGTYRATLRHRDDGAPLQTFRVRVQPAPPPLRIAAIRVQPESPRAGQPVAFEPVLQSGTPVDYEWGLGNGTKAFTRAPVYTYPTPGTYDITLQVSGPAGQATYARQITVAAAPEPVQPRIERAPVVARVQLGAFSTAARAKQFASRHADRLPKPPDVQEDPRTGLYRVTLPYSDVGTAREALDRLRQTAPFSDAFLKRTNY